MGGKHFSVFRLESVGLAYVLLNEFCQDGHELYEISPLSEGSLLIISSNNFDSLKDKSQQLVEEYELSEDFFVILRSLDQKILKAYHSLELAVPEKNLTIVESPFIGDLFFIAQNLNEGAEIVDLRSIKSSENNYLMVKDLDPELRSELVEQGYAVATIDSLHQKVKELFTY